MIARRPSRWVEALASGANKDAAISALIESLTDIHRLDDSDFPTALIMGVEHLGRSEEVGSGAARA